MYSQKNTPTILELCYLSKNVFFFNKSQPVSGETTRDSQGECAHLQASPPLWTKIDPKGGKVPNTNSKQQKDSKG